MANTQVQLFSQGVVITVKKPGWKPSISFTLSHSDFDEFARQVETVVRQKGFKSPPPTKTQ